MNLDLTEDQIQIRDAVRELCRAEFAPHAAKWDAEQGVPHWAIDKLAEQGFLGMAIPEEWGGVGYDARTIVIVLEEIARVSAALAIMIAVHNSVGALPVFRFGTEAQKKRFLPRMYNGEDFWCQGYSEPGSGSDLASLKTKAERASDKSGDHYVVNGQKIWTTLGHYADWIFCLVRTDSTLAKRQEGISFLLIDMRTPGITVRPLVLMDGGHEVNEVFFDNVKVPVENLVHEEGKGWTVAKYLLGHERMNTGRIGASKRELAKLKDFAARQPGDDGLPLIEDARFRDRLTRVEVELMALEITNLRFLDQMRRSGQPPGADVSMLKIKGTEIQQGLTELSMQAVGPLAQPFRATGTDLEDGAFDRFTAGLAPRYCNYRKTTIYAGSNEIQRNIISKMTLGL